MFLTRWCFFLGGLDKELKTRCKHQNLMKIYLWQWGIPQFLSHFKLQNKNPKLILYEKSYIFSKTLNHPHLACLECFSKCGGTQMAKIQYIELSCRTYLEYNLMGISPPAQFLFSPLQVHISQTALIIVFIINLRQKKFERVEQTYAFCLHGLHISKLLFLGNSNPGEITYTGFCPTTDQLPPELYIFQFLGCLYFSLQKTVIFLIILCNIFVSQ